MDIEALTDIAHEAGRLGRNHFGHVTAERKADGTLVTVADRDMQRLIEQRLRALVPDPRELYLLGEEDTDLPNPGVDDPRDARLVAAVDPLDGTTSFATGLPLWGVSIGLLARDRPVAGVLYMPLLGGPEGWTYRVDTTGPATLNGVPLELAPHRGFGKFSGVAVPSGFHRWARLRPFRGKLRSLGSTAHHVALVASGGMEAAVVGRAHLWDLAAAAAVLERAGGVLRTTGGAPVDWVALYADRMQADPLIAGSPEAVDALVKVLEVRPSPGS